VARRRSEPAQPRLLEAEQGPIRDGVGQLVLHTDRGPIACRVHPAGGREGIVWVGGVGGGLEGPAGGLYARLAERVAARGIASLRVGYRRPTDLRECIRDAHVAVRHMGARGHDRIALVGHSAGGAVAIAAGSRSPAVVAVAALAVQGMRTAARTKANMRPAPRRRKVRRTSRFMKDSFLTELLVMDEMATTAGAGSALHQPRCPGTSFFSVRHMSHLLAGNWKPRPTKRGV